ncbi:MAG TPA: flagellar hook capping FlgD N-terminal domain-containing protein [Baekduia sp.]|nr:flagellar hook capping FlgD N-terminal domain-containing protein [Baekduia sp.]
MATNPVSSAYTPPAYQSKPTSSSSLDKDGFLRMLTEQIKNQDPQSNQDPSQYFQTISQMTLVEQMTNLASQSRIDSAQSLLGRTVTYAGTGTNPPTTGVVDGVDLSDPSGPRISVDGVVGIDPSRVQQVS